MKIAYLDPNADGGVIQWTPVPFGDNFRAVDDGVRRPTVPNLLDYCYTSSFSDQYDDFELKDLSDVDSVSSIEVTVYGKTQSTIISVNLFIKGAWQGYQTLLNPNGVGWAWYNYTGTWTQAEINAAVVRIRHQRVVGGVSTDYAVYAKVTYTVSANPYPKSLLRKGLVSAFHCFMSGYLRAKVGGYDPLKLPDGTVF